MQQAGLCFIEFSLVRPQFDALCYDAASIYLYGLPEGAAFGEIKSLLYTYGIADMFLSDGQHGIVFLLAFLTDYAFSMKTVSIIYHHQHHRHPLSLLCTSSLANLKFGGKYRSWFRWSAAGCLLFVFNFQTRF
jgi:hypothetical protein